jgi:prepilin-type N-terminal cleavage/methylation domain-containing protein
MKGERGFTLIELMIAVTLVAALSTGMLIAMRTGLVTLEKTETRLHENRRVVSIQQMLIRQLEGIMPVTGDCATGRSPMFAGTDQFLRFVTSYSMEQGARGYPQLVQIQIVPDSQGGFRVVENEHLYFSPSSTVLFCAPQPPAANSFEIAHGLATGRIVYRDYAPADANGGKLIPIWDRPNLPSTVRIEMIPLRPEANRLNVQTVDVPISINRQVQGIYEDRDQ